MEVKTSTVKMTPENATVQVGDSITLQCHYTTKLHNIWVSWYHQVSQHSRKKQIFLCYSWPFSNEKLDEKCPEYCPIDGSMWVSDLHGDICRYTENTVDWCLNRTHYDVPTDTDLRQRLAMNIINVRLLDEGWYHCEIDYEEFINGPESEKIYLQVTGNCVDYTDKLIVAAYFLFLLV